MPGFIRTAKDEARWSQAKQNVVESKGKDEASFNDTDWALVNHIYHGVKKAALASKIEALTKLCSTDEKALKALNKARRLFDDYSNLDDEQSLEDELDSQGLQTFDPDQPEEESNETPQELEDYPEIDPEAENDSEQEDQDPEQESDPEIEELDPAKQWLQQNDPKRKRGKTDEQDKEPTDEMPEMDPQHRESIETKNAEPDASKRIAETTATQETPAQSPKEEVAQRKSRFIQPTKQELNELREHTEPWARYERSKTAMEADPLKNPELFHTGKLIAARQRAHGGFQAAYQQFKNSDRYTTADKITRRKMDVDFKQGWHKDNPDHLEHASQLHAIATDEGSKVKDRFKEEQASQLQHAMRGASGPTGTMSREAAAQHVGGERGDEGTFSSIEQDPMAAFAARNSEFMAHYAKEHGTVPKAKDFSESELRDWRANQQSGEDTDYSTPSEHGSEATAAPSASAILGDSPSLKDPAKKQHLDQFFAHHWPIVEMNAKRVVKQLGLNKDTVDEGALHEAGMKGLFSAVNDYDHDHPSQASFASHAGKKIHGLMMTALRAQDRVPAELRQKAKQFYAQRQAPVTSITTPKSVAVSPEPTSEPTVSKPVSTPPSPPPPPKKSPQEFLAGMTHSQKDRMSTNLKGVDASRASKIIRRRGNE